MGLQYHRLTHGYEIHEIHEIHEGQVFTRILWSVYGVLYL